jgi:hypothetical protein
MPAAPSRPSRHGDPWPQMQRAALQHGELRWRARPGARYGDLGPSFPIGGTIVPGEGCAAWEIVGPRGLCRLFVDLESLDDNSGHHRLLTDISRIYTRPAENTISHRMGVSRRIPTYGQRDTFASQHTSGKPGSIFVTECRQRFWRSWGGADSEKDPHDRR